LPQATEHSPAAPAGGARTGGGDVRGQPPDAPGEAARRAVRVGDLGPADEALVGRRLEEDPRAPAGVAEERLEARDLHRAGAYGYGSRAIPGRAAVPPAVSASARAPAPPSAPVKPP